MILSVQILPEHFIIQIKPFSVYVLRLRPPPKICPSALIFLPVNKPFPCELNNARVVLGMGMRNLRQREGDLRAVSIVRACWDSWWTALCACVLRQTWETESCTLGPSPILCRSQLWPGKNIQKQTIWVGQEQSELQEHSWGTCGAPVERLMPC